MGMHSRLLVDQETFTASTQTLNIPADNVKYLQFGIGALQNGTDAPTLANIQGVIDRVIVNLGGHEICNIRFADLVQYNLEVLDNWPTFRLGGGDNYLAGEWGVRLPIYVTKRGRTLTMQVTFGTAITNCDNTTLSVAYEYQDAPFERHFAYQYESKAGAAQVQWLGLNRIGAVCQGLLIYMPWTSVDDNPATPEISKIEAFVDDRVVWTDNLFTLKAHHQSSNQTDSNATFGDKYAQYSYFIDWSQEPWSANKMTLITYNACGAYNSGAVGTCIIMGVYNEL